MLHTQNLEQFTMQASVPDQLLHYVQAVSSTQSQVLGNYLLHMNGAHAVLVGYALHDVHDTTQLENCVQGLINSKDIEEISILAPQAPNNIPSTAQQTQDHYYFVPLPLDINVHANAKNMCKHALTHIYIEKTDGKDAWSSEHQRLMLEYVRRKDVSKDMGSIFQHLEMYCKSSPHVQVFSAYATDTQHLLAFTVADFSSWRTAFYMFSMRWNFAISGTSDALLWTLLQEAEARGYTSCNLGLGINAGIVFFKTKWGAKPSLPFVQCSWKVEENIAIPQERNGLFRKFSRLWGGA